MVVSLRGQAESFSRGFSRGSTSDLDPASIVRMNFRPFQSMTIAGRRFGVDSWLISATKATTRAGAFGRARMRWSFYSRTIQGILLCGAFALCTC